MSKTIAIAGLGWLGVPLAHSLSTLGFQIKGSVTSEEKARKMSSQGIDTYAIEISEEGIRGESTQFLQDVSILIVLIPPGIRRNTGADFVQKMSNLLSVVEKNKAEKVILVSSTSVYGDSQGPVTEKDHPKPSTMVGEQLLQVESLFSNSQKIDLSIVRFGGLFGGSREPVRYLAGRKNLIDGNAPVNLIHRDDCIAILSEIIKQDAFGYTFNAVIPKHPIKREYYTQKATALNLTPPHYSDEGTDSNHKQVDSENITAVLNYSFKHLF